MAPKNIEDVDLYALLDLTIAASESEVNIYFIVVVLYFVFL